MAEDSWRCRTCGTEDVLVDEWTNEDGSIKAHLCVECMTKDENSMFWINCVCENCGEDCELQRHFVTRIHKMRKDGVKVCTGCKYPNCDGRPHFYCQVCQICFLEGEAGINRLKDKIARETSLFLANQAKARSKWRCDDLLIAALIPLVIGGLLYVVN